MAVQVQGHNRMYLPSLNIISIIGQYFVFFSTELLLGATHSPGIVGIHRKKWLAVYVDNYNSIASCS